MLKCPFALRPLADRLQRLQGCSHDLSVIDRRRRGIWLIDSSTERGDVVRCYGAVRLSTAGMRHISPEGRPRIDEILGLLASSQHHRCVILAGMPGLAALMPHCPLYKATKRFRPSAQPDLCDELARVALRWVSGLHFKERL
jgi:hypothetical protein